MSAKILISSIGGLLAQNVSKCIRDEFPDSLIFGTDIAFENAGKLFCDEMFIVPKANSEEFLINLKLIVAKFNPDFYFPLNESEIDVLTRTPQNELNRIFGKCKIIWASEEARRFFLDKELTMEFLKKLGIDIPEIFDAKSISNARFPLVVKPSNSSGSKGIFVCNNHDEVNAACVFVNKPVIQEYIGSPDEEFTAGVYSHDGQNVSVIAFRRRLSPGGGTSWCETILDQEITDICNRVARAIRLIGSINLQMRKQNNKYLVFEINPRFSSTAHIRHLIGFKDVIWSLTGVAPQWQITATSKSTFAVIQQATKLA